MDSQPEFAEYLFQQFLEEILFILKVQVKGAAGYPSPRNDISDVGAMITFTRENSLGMLQHLLTRHSSLARQRIEVLGADGLFEVAGGNRMIRPGPNPRLCDMALAGLLEFFDEFSQAASQDAPCRAARNEIAEAAEPIA